MCIRYCWSSTRPIVSRTLYPRIIAISLRTRVSILVPITVPIAVLIPVTVLPGIRIVRIGICLCSCFCSVSISRLSLPRVIPILIIFVLIIAIVRTWLRVARRSRLTLPLLSSALRSPVLILIAAPFAAITL
jgi:hypothetical protein